MVILTVNKSFEKVSPFGIVPIESMPAFDSFNWKYKVANNRPILLEDM